MIERRYRNGLRSWGCVSGVSISKLCEDSGDGAVGMALEEIEFPPYIKTLSERAWYMRNHLGMTCREVGEVLHKSDMAIARRLKEIDDRRYRKSTVFKRFHSFCLEECEDHDCRDCKLFRFVVTKLVG